MLKQKVLERFFKKIIFLCLLSLFVPRQTIAYIVSADLEIAGDDHADFYINGIHGGTTGWNFDQITSYSTADGTLDLHDFLPNQTNLIAVDNPPNTSGPQTVTFRLTVHYSDAPTVVIYSNPDANVKFLYVPGGCGCTNPPGGCAGQLAVPPANWMMPGFDDSTWGTPIDDTPGIGQWMYYIMPAPPNVPYSYVPYLGNGPSAWGLINNNCGDMNLYREYFFFPGSDIDLSKASDVTVSATGGTVNYTFTMGSFDEDASTVTVYDTVPAGMAFVSATGGGTYNPVTNLVSWTFTLSGSVTFNYADQYISSVINAPGWTNPGNTIGAPDGNFATLTPGNTGWFQIGPSGVVNQNQYVIAGVMFHSTIQGVNGGDGLVNPLYFNYSMDGTNNGFLGAPADIMRETFDGNTDDGYYDATADTNWTWADLNNLRVSYYNTVSGPADASAVDSCEVVVKYYLPSVPPFGFAAMVTTTACPGLLDNTGTLQGTGLVATTSNDAQVALYCAPTNTSTSTATDTATSTSTSTCTPTITTTATASPTGSSTCTSTITNTITSTSTSSATATVSPTASSTRTSTNSATATATMTVSPSATSTSTATITATATATMTVSPSATSTRTATNTATSTATMTVSPSATDTSTATITGTSTTTMTVSPSATSTNTATNTATSSATLTSSPSLTATYTNLFTSTNTYTVTASPTASGTYTATNTFTTTATLTVSPSASATYTSTNTPTPTATLTVSPSASATFTFINTSTVTATLTASPTGSATITQSNTQTITLTTTYTPTYSITNTPSSTQTPSLTITSSLTNTVTLTKTFSYTFTNTGTASNTATPSCTSTPSNTSTPPFSPTQTLTWTNTVTPSKTLTSSCTPTITPPVLNVDLVIYATNGEVVKTLGWVPIFGDLSDLTITLGGSGSLMEDSGVPLEILLTTKKGQWQIPWDGTNDLGAMVQPGDYILKSQVTQFGKATTFTNSVIVTSLGNHLKVDIYTTSGELVKEIYQGYSTSGQLEGISLTNNLLLTGPGQNTTVGVGALGDNGLYLSDSNGTLAPGRILWDGTNSLGNLVQNGEYILKADQVYNGRIVTYSKSITVLVSSSNPGFDAKAYPNPYREMGSQTIYFKVDINQAASIRINIYNVAGNLIMTLTAAGSGTLAIPWNVGKMSAGLYLAAVEADTPAANYRTITKVIIIR